jgi:hypothetical protein
LIVAAIEPVAGLAPGCGRFRVRIDYRFAGSAAPGAGFGYRKAGELQIDKG